MAAKAKTQAVVTPRIQVLYNKFSNDRANMTVAERLELIELLMKAGHLSYSEYHKEIKLAKQEGKK